MALLSAPEQNRKPYLGLIQSQTVRHVRPLVPSTLIAARYRGAAVPDSTKANAVLLKHHKPASNVTSELALKVKVQLGNPRSVSVSSTPESQVIDAIYGASQAGRNIGTEDFTSLLAQVAGSSDSEVQAARAGALKPNATADTMALDPPGSDSSDEDSALADPPSLGGPSKATSTLVGQEPTLSGDESDSSDDESDGEGAAGLVPTIQHPGDVTMNTVDGTSSSEGEDEDEDEEEEDGAEEDGAEGEEGAEDEDDN